MKKIILISFLISVFISCSKKELSETEIIKQIFQEAEQSTVSYKNLKYLTDHFQKRLACYPEGIEAAKWTKQLMENMNLDRVFLQEITVMNWERGTIEEGRILLNNRAIDVNVCALGRGISTPEKGIRAKVIEVNGLEDLKNFTPDETKGKIIFFNQAMNPELKNTFQAYGEAAGQRFNGPAMAAQHGAVGAIIRSLTTSIDTFPHTGTTRKMDDSETVPAVSIATKHANLLSEKLKKNPDLEFYFKTNCKNKPDTISYNAIGEITGSEFPNEYIVVGGHLDSWDNSGGAHDDGGGCMQAIEVLRIFKEIDYKPKRSIRAVMFMDEEISQGGGRDYARTAKEKNEIHIFALESDRGVTKPLGFSFDVTEKDFERITEWMPLFKPYGIDTFTKGGGGVDIGPLKENGTALSGLLTDPANYFDWHHSGNDTFDHIVREDMQKGAAAMAALIYLIDKNGLE